ncbi:MAG: hypothetical protein DRP08_07735 [Candidatus Aenigmatarchaeota archaeon]|nr:MAG: hypothetical protein DRP08_07735 [Candidatus Aenigmarchaeota archaeon]
MPISNFDGETFVAFVDISGFKRLMKDENRALKALDKLYQYGYEVIKKNRQSTGPSVEGFFVSDSGILFIRNCLDKIECLKVLLIAVRELNKRMLNHGFKLTTSIAYGHFKYQERIEFKGIEKNLIYGNAYVSAFLDNEGGKPKIQPGQCRIVKKNLPKEIIKFIENNDDEISRMIRKRKNDNNHYYFYWDC